MLEVVDRGRSLDDLIHGSWFKSLSASPRDLALSREISFGLCRWYPALQGLLAGRMQKPLRQRDRDIEMVLLIGLYQILVLETDDHAAVNETVQLARGLKKTWATGLVNAVLRGVIRDGVRLDEQSRYQATPEWMRRRIETDWDEAAPAILEA